MSGSRRSLGAQETISISPGDPLRDLFEACKHGDVSRVRTLVTPQNVNARDTAGRKSSPLHFAAGRIIGGLLTGGYWKIVIFRMTFKLKNCLIF